MNEVARFVKGHLPAPAPAPAPASDDLFSKTMDAIKVALAASPAPRAAPPPRPVPLPKTEAVCKSIETGYASNGVRVWTFRYADGTVYQTADAGRAQSLAEQHFPHGARLNKEASTTSDTYD